MTANAETFLADLARFTESSLTWCASQSLDATQGVASALEYLVTDAERAANASPASRAALSALRDASQGDATNARAFATRIGILARQHKDAADLAAPLVEALQFQDFLQQALMNQARIVQTWLAARANGESLTIFGEKLVKIGTTTVEREIVRKHIAGLAPEAEAGEVGLF